MQTILGTSDTVKRMFEQLAPSTSLPCLFAGIHFPLFDGKLVCVAHDEQELYRMREDVLVKWQRRLAEMVLNRTRGKPFHKIAFHGLLSSMPLAPSVPSKRTTGGQPVPDAVKLIPRLVSVFHGSGQDANTVHVTGIVIANTRHISLVLHPYLPAGVLDITNPRVKRILSALEILVKIEGAEG